MSTTTTTMKVMWFRKSQLSNQNYKVRTPTRDKNGISLLFEYYNQVRTMTEREKENWKKKKTSETKWIDSLWCAVTKNVSALLCWTTLLPTRSQPWHLFWMVSGDSSGIVVVSHHCFFILVFVFAGWLLIIAHIALVISEIMTWLVTLTSQWLNSVQEQQMYLKLCNIMLRKEKNTTVSLLSRIVAQTEPRSFSINSSNNEPRCLITSNLTFPFDHEHILTLTVTL